MWSHHADCERTVPWIGPVAGAAHRIACCTSVPGLLGSGLVAVEGGGVDDPLLGLVGGNPFGGEDVLGSHRDGCFVLSLGGSDILWTVDEWFRLVVLELVCYGVGRVAIGDGIDGSGGLLGVSLSTAADLKDGIPVGNLVGTVDERTRSFCKPEINSETEMRCKKNYAG